jgi:predicted nucleotidyltransferase
MFPSRDEIRRHFVARNSTEAHERLIDATCEVCKTISEVEAVLLRGSLARGYGDVNSDIDLLILTAGGRDGQGRVQAELAKRISEIGTVLLRFQSMANASDLIVCFAPWVMLEFNVRAAEEGGRTWKTARSRLVYDRKGLGAAALAQADLIKFQVTGVKPRIENLARAFPALCTVIWGYYMRGEIVTALSDMGWLRDQMLSVSGLLLGLWDEGPRRAERRFPQPVLAYYMRCYPRDESELASALAAAAEWYEMWLVPRLDELGIPHSCELLETARMVMAASGP